MIVMTKDRSKHRLDAVGEVLDSVESDGMPGLVKTMFRMIGDDQPSVDCLIEADNAFQSAATAEQVWGAALGMAACLRGAMLEPDVPEPPPPPPDHPDPPPPHDWRDNVADIVLAGLLVRVRDGK